MRALFATARSFEKGDGCVDVVPTESGHILFCGSSGAINRVSLQDWADAPPEQLWRTAEPLLAMAVSQDGSRMAVACADKCVRVFRITASGALEFVSIATRFQLAPLCVALSATGNHLACGSEDGKLTYLDITMMDEPRALFTYAFDKGPILSVAIDPRGEFVAFTSVDALRTVTLADGKLAHMNRNSFDPSTAAAAGARPVRRVTWDHAGDTLAVPGRNGQVVFYGRALTSTDLKLVAGHDGNPHLSLVALSRNGRYLASCCGNNDTRTSVTLWDLRANGGKGEAVTEQLVGHEVVAMQWCPKGNAIVLALRGGAVAVWDAAVPSELTGPCDMTGVNDDMAALARLVANDDDNVNTSSNSNAKSDDADAKQAAPPPPLALETSDGNAAATASATTFGNDDDDDAELLRAVSEAEAGLSLKRPAAAVATAPSSASSVVAAVAAETPASKRNRLRKNSDERDDELDILLPEEPAQDVYATPGNAASSASSSSSLASTQALVAAVEALVARHNLQPLQISFAPSASTATSAASNRRVLVWNRVGRVICVDDRAESIVEVEFADVTMHRKIRVADLYAYTMGALSEAGVALAAAASEEQGTRAVVHFKPVNGLVGGSEWQDMLEAGDDVAGVALGNDWIAAVTLPYHYLRLWSVSGLQQLPLQLPVSKFVAMVGQGTRLAVFHHTPAGLHALVYDVALQRQVFSIAAPLTAGAELTWCGFTPTGVLVTVDSAGVGRVLINAGGWAGQWVPLTQPEGRIDVSRRWPLGWPIGATDDSLVVVRLTESEETLSGLVLDDDNRGAPIIDTVRWTAPLVNPNSALTTGLETVLRRRLLASQSAEPSARRQLEIDSEVVKLIALAAKNGLSQRGLELFRMIRAPQLQLAALKWCGANGHDALFARMESEWRAQAAALADDGVDAAEQGGKQQHQQQLEKQPRRQASKRVAHDDEDDEGAVFDDERRDDSPPTRASSNESAQNKPSAKKHAALKANPFGKAAGGGLRRSSSGGVFEALARIEAQRKPA